MKLDLTKVTRVEVIDGRGRAHYRHGLDEVTAELQDGGRTLKLFVSGDEDEYYALKVTKHGVVRPPAPEPAQDEAGDRVWVEEGWMHS
jgi:hypothetical protein